MNIFRLPFIPNCDYPKLSRAMNKFKERLMLDGLK